MPVTIKGEIFSGVLRGKPLMEKYYHRIIGVLGFEPFKGTLDVRLERKIDIMAFSEKFLDHLLMDGSRHIDACFARVKVRIRKNEYDCWAMRQMNGIYEDDVIELIGKDCFREKLDLTDGQELGITFFEQEKKKKGFRVPKFLKKKIKK